MARREYRITPKSTLLYIALRNLWHKRLRSGLTVLGIAIGIGAIFFLLSFGLGLRDLVTNEILGNTSIKSVDVTSPNSQIIQLNEALTSKVGNLPHVVQTGRSFSFPTSLRFDASEVNNVVYGVDAQYINMLDFNIVDGRLLKNDDGKVAVINRAALDTIGAAPKDIVGKQIELTILLQGDGIDKKEISDSYVVVGVVESGSGSEVYVPKFVFDTAGIKTYSQVKLIVDETSNVGDVRQQIESLGLETVSPVDTLEQINQIFRFFNFALIGLGAIGMVIAILGMFNTLTISLLERTKEIGLMVALGARQHDVRIMFIVEALLLSLIGAIGGIVTAIYTGKLVNATLNAYANQRGVEGTFELFSTPLWLVGVLVLFMMFVGLTVVFFPARRAEHIDPIDALRRE